MVGQNPAETLNRANDELMAQNPGNLFVTAFAAVLYPATGELVYANAGHTYPVLLKEGPEYIIPDSGIALGMFEDSALTDHTVTLMPGQGLLLYTDGVTEAVDGGRELFGDGRLLDAVKGYTGKTETGKEVILDVCRSVDEFCDGNEQFDDMALSVLLYKGLRLIDLNVDQASFEEVKKEVFSIAGDNAKTRRALLACDEALTNIIRYSKATDLKYCCDKQNSLLRVMFSDNGIAFDPTNAETEEREFNFLENGGMGISIIRQAAVSVHYVRSYERNMLTLYFPI